MQFYVVEILYYFSKYIISAAMKNRNALLHYNCLRTNYTSKLLLNTLLISTICAERRNFY
jgi:hypothetical protein